MKPIELPTLAPAARAQPRWSVTRMADEVRALAEERNAVILAHNYQVPEVQDVAALRGRLARPVAPGGRRPTPT